MSEEQRCWQHGPASVCPCDKVYSTEVEYLREELKVTLQRAEDAELELGNLLVESDRDSKWGDRN